MSEQAQLIARQEWSSPERRTVVETHFNTPLSSFGHTFRSDQYRALLGLATLAEGVLVAMNNDCGEGRNNFQAPSIVNFGNADGSFSDGVLLFGAVDRETAQAYQPDFVDRVNTALGRLGTDIRLA